MALPAAAAATIVVESERDGEAVNIRAKADLKADVATAWRVLTDYDRYVEFIPDLAPKPCRCTARLDGDRRAVWRCGLVVQLAS